MNPNAQCYHINSPRIIHETLDRETVIIDTETGVYFVVGGSGPLIWAALEHGAEAQALAHGLASHFGADPASILPFVGEFLARLHDEALIVAAPHTVVTGALFDGAASFVPPTLQKFTDMEELLLIDPIHEVEDSGWPNRRKATGS